MIDEKIKNYVTTLNEKAKEIDGDFARAYDFSQQKIKNKFEFEEEKIKWKNVYTLMKMKKESQ